jgi:hypothetical protein
MALTTYDELQSAIGTWLARDDLTASIPDFITLFEAVANRRLRTRQMETTATLTPASGDATLPTDYLAWRRLTWTGDTRVELEYVHPSWLQAAYPDTPSGTPKHFTIEGSKLKVRPTSTTDLEFDYFEKIDALADGVNWLFSSHPDIYLFGSLCEAQGFVDDPERLVLWKARRDEGFEELERLSRRTSGPAAIRIIGNVV